LAIQAIAELKKSNFSKLPVLIIAGGQPAEGGKDYMDQLQKLTVDNNLQKDIIFTGFINDDNPLLADIFYLSTAFVYPYLPRTTASAALSAVLDYKKPIIASDIEYFKEYNFLLKFKSQDFLDLADIIKNFLTKNSFENDDYKNKLDQFLANNSQDILLTKQLSGLY